jgi:hypothetical protein
MGHSLFCLLALHHPGQECVEWHSILCKERKTIRWIHFWRWEDNFGGGNKWTSRQTWVCLQVHVGTICCSAASKQLSYIACILKHLGMELLTNPWDGLASLKLSGLGPWCVMRLSYYALNSPTILVVGRTSWCSTTNLSDSPKTSKQTHICTRRTLKWWPTLLSQSN